MFIGIMGLLLGTVGGLFTLGIISNRATGFHAWLGTIAGIASLIVIKLQFKMNLLMNSTVAVVVCVLVGWLSSLLLPLGTPRVAGLTLRNRGV